MPLRVIWDPPNHRKNPLILATKTRRGCRCLTSKRGARGVRYTQIPNALPAGSRGAAEAMKRLPPATSVDLGIRGDDIHAARGSAPSLLPCRSLTRRDGGLIADIGHLANRA